jgi:hypothetical protein
MAKGRGQKGEGRREKAEGRREKAEGRGQEAGGKRLLTSCFSRSIGSHLPDYGYR